MPAATACTHTYHTSCGVHCRAICAGGKLKPQSIGQLCYHKVPWPSSKDLGSIQGRLRTVYNASTTTQPTSSAISDTSVRMEREARKSGQEGSLWIYSTTSTSSWNRNKMQKPARLGDRRTTIRELQWVRCRKTGFRPSLRITPLLPGCCQSLPARISHGPLSNPRAFDAMSAACCHRQGGS